MERADSVRGATRFLVLGLLALAGCGHEDATTDVKGARSTAAALESGTDLVVTQVRGPASLRNGQDFTATVTVCNQGTVPTSYYNRPRLELFLSTDAELTLPDPGQPPPSPPEDQVSIGWVELDTLYEGQCVTKSVPAHAWLPPAAQGDGAYYLAAAVDTTGVEQELHEDNNVRVGGLLGVGYRADLVVSEVSSPASVRNGQSFTATVKVCNPGTAPTTGSYYPYYTRARVELFLSTDAELTLPDPSQPSPVIPMDQVSIGWVELADTLYEGQCVTRSVPVNAWLPPAAQGDGAYYLIAAVDTAGAEQELREDNNIRVSGLMGVGNQPDLVVSEVRAPASVGPWQSFTASVKVCNQGTEPAFPGGYYSSPQVELFLASDATASIPADAMTIGSAMLDQPLYPGQCVTKSLYASANPPPQSQQNGAYYLVATVDRAGLMQELREDNNVRVGELLSMGYQPDLVVTEVRGPASVWNGQNFTATVKVCNQGTTPTTSYYSRPRLELFLSTQAELTLPSPGMPYPGPSQVSIGWVELDKLYEGQCVTKDVPANAWLPAAAQGDGAYYLAAAVDTTWVEQELREDNNVRVGGLLGVGYRSDLVVTEISRPASVGNGQNFTASVKVCNQGTSPTSSYSSTPRLELYLSMDSELTLPEPGMPYPSPAKDQMLIGSVDLNQPLNPAQCVTKDVYANAWLPPAALVDGAFYVAAAVDTTWMEQELREDNNTYVGGLMGVGYRSDLVVSEVSGPASVGNGQSFTASVKVCNQGATPTTGGYNGMPRVELFLSTDTELTLPEPGMPYPGMASDQVSIGSVELGPQLYPGQCVTKNVSANAWLPPTAQGDGAYYLAAAVDTTWVEQELREDNNARVGNLMGVGNRSDLVVSEVSAPASVGNSQSFTASVKVCNQGTSPTNSYYGTPRVELFLSADGTFSMPSPGMPYPGQPANQVSIGWVELNQTLFPSQCVTKDVPANAWLPPSAQGDGAYQLVAAVDTTWVEQELREDNNVRMGGLLGVGYRSDLVVTEVSGPASVGNGQSFTATVKVCNQGSSPTSSYSSTPRVELFLSMDTELTHPYPGGTPYPGMQTAPDQVFIGSVELNQTLYPAQCVTKNVYATAWLPSAAQGDGAYYLAAIVDTTWVEQELREDNNTRVGSLLGVGNRSDLVVSEVSAPASVGNGQFFTASVKVCNQGSSPTSSNPYSRPRVELYLSTDTELMLPSPGSPYPPPGMTMDQSLIGWVELDQPLYPSQCVTKDVPANAWPPTEPQGTNAYYLAAAVDTTWVEQELREDNNVRVGGLLGVGYQADLVVSEVSGPASVQNGQSFSATVKVCNQGAAPTNSYSSRPNVELFLSMDATFSMPTPGMPYPGPTSSISIGYMELDQTLYPGQCVTKSVPANAWPPPMAMGDGAYYLAAAVDTNRVEQELREDNNTRVGGLLGVGYRADLVVSEVSGPASVQNGQSFTATVKVCNQGTSPTNSYYSWPQVEVFLSTDAAFSMPSPGAPYPYPGVPAEQVSIGYVALDQPLYPSQCVTKSVPVNAWLPPEAQGDGAYYLAAAVDTTWVEQELREDNNTRVGGLMGVGYRADLVVTEVRGPASVWNGQSFTGSVKVCNQGTSPTSGGSYSRPRVELFLSTNATFSMPSPGTPYPPPSGPAEQVSIGYVELDQTLYPSQCVTRDVSANAWLPPAAQGDGAYYLAAAVDTNQVEQELREDNNIHVSGLMGVGNRADLVVSEVSGPASVGNGQSFTATVKVCNQGTSPTSGGSYSKPRVELYLSTDTELTLPSPGAPYPPPGMAMDQTLIGSVELDQPLSPSQCVTKSVPANAWLPPAAQGDGAYYLAAAVDTTWVEQELREDNNVRVGGLLGVGNRADLVVSEVSGPASVGNGQSFTATVKVCNQGPSPTSSYYSRPQVEVFLSTDTELTLPTPGSPYPPPGMAMDQMLIGSVELNQPLYPSQCVTKSVPVNAWLPPQAQGDGAYYLAAAVDTNQAEQELREDNNIRVGGLMGVGSRSDLVVTEVSGPASVNTNQSFTASVKVCNQGTSPTSSYSSTPRVELFLSTNATFSMPSPGTPYPPPGMPAEQVSIGYVELGQPLSPSQCVTKSVPANAWLPPAAQGDGAYYLAAAVDTNQVEQELREDNNARVGSLLGVGNRADLVVNEVSGPASVGNGQGFTATVKVCNQGTMPTSGGYYSKPRVELYLSTDTELTLPSPGSPYPPPGMAMDQMLIGSVDLDQPLYPSQCVTKSVPANAWLPPQAQGDGAYYLAAAVDTTWMEQELREDNNVRVGNLMGVGNRSDLVVSEVNSPASVSNGQSFTATVKVCNQGTTPTSSGSYSRPRVELYLSTDTELTLPSQGSPYPPPGMAMDQTLIGSVELDQPLSPSQCVTKDVPANAWLPPQAQGDGAYYLAAAVDTTWMEQELREDNNVRVGNLMGVGNRSDLVVSEVNSPASVSNGQSFTATVKVCNQGTTPTSGSYSRPRVDLYLSTDTELTLPTSGSPYPPPGMAMDQTLIGSVELDQPLSPSQCVTKDVLANTWLPPEAHGDGAYYLAAAVDTNQAEQELREDNNAQVGGLIGVGHRADLVVSEVGGPPSVENGQSFTATVKVCNQGTTPTSGYASGPRVELYLSTDTELSLPSPDSPYPMPPGMAMDQTLIGSVELNQPLSPGQCVTKSVPANAWLPPAAQGDGAYYLAAAVDTTWMEQELREDNNVRVSDPMGVGHRADLVVSEVSGPASVHNGQSFTANVKVCNQGTAPTLGQTWLEVLLSMDADLSFFTPGEPPANDQLKVGSFGVDPLPAGQCVTLAVPATAWLPPAAPKGSGTFHLGAIIDAPRAEQELREDNNTRANSTLEVTL
ncbi:CARDB domain-containing protein [Vitiosangium sp. GDMCC 1.1324]|uniref:CARDB domain-containing protein n=1 Tax=Vitiosangium sp. (strain GDMCC 1.1324) TaxID=2138576 RepID=UPI00130D7335|nr:CARDB domain-containing protein [Vitiosangium sp. GDMCC 1.1324]